MSFNDPPTEIEMRVGQFLEGQGVAAGATLIAAVSGGADSLALLFSLARWREALRYDLRAATLHHGMRAEADADVAMLQALCLDLGIPLSVGRADVPGLAARRKVSLEVAGREARYAFLYDTARDHGAHAVCTGHTLDDQAETVLLRVISGTGLEGLGGIFPARRVEPPESPAPVWLWRPLLDTSRAETQGYCAAKGLDPVQDPANMDLRYPRNRIRHDLIPRLECDFNPAIREALARLADLARADEALLSELAESAFDIQAIEGGARLHRKPLASLPLAVQRRVARRFLRAAGATGRALGYGNVERLLDAVENGAPRLHLDGGLELSCDAEHATLRPILPPAAVNEFEVPVAVPGTTVLSGCVLVTEVLSGGPVPSAGPWEAFLDLEALEEPLVARNRRAGDRMQPLGLSGTRKVGDMMTDHKVPRSARDTLPLLVSGDRIVWAPGLAVSETARVTPATHRVLHVRLSPPLFTTSQAGKRMY